MSRLAPPVCVSSRPLSPCAPVSSSWVVGPLTSAEDTPLTALALAMLWRKAGGPPGVVNVVPTSRELVQEVGLVLTGHESVRKVSFTGSTVVGKQLLQQAAGTVKKSSMELGGNAPFLVRRGDRPGSSPAMHWQQELVGVGEAGSGRRSAAGDPCLAAAVPAWR